MKIKIKIKKTLEVTGTDYLKTPSEYYGITSSKD